MKVKVYGIPNCNTVKKAQDWLKSGQLDFEFHNFKKEGITPEKLNLWFEAFGWEKVINKQGLTFRKLTKEEQQDIDTPDQAISYLMQNTSAIKRPVLELDGKPVLIGFNEAAYSAGLS